MSQSNISLYERLVIEFYFDKGKSVIFIAKDLKRNRSTIYREIKRNSYYQCHYFSTHAHLKSEKTKRNSHKPYKSNDENLLLKIKKILEYRVNLVLIKLQI